MSEFFGNERTRSTPLDPKLMVWRILYCLIAFGTVLLRYETRFKTGRTGAINPSSCREVVSEFSATNAPDPPHWTLNSWFGAFPTVCVHLGPFRRLMKLGLKRSKLVQLIQKFMPRSRIGIFGTNAPDPLHWTLNSWFGAFCTVWVPLGPFCHLTVLC